MRPHRTYILAPLVLKPVACDTPLARRRTSQCTPLIPLQMLHLSGQRDPLRVDERQHLVVVHHRVHVLDPDGVHGTIEQDPLLVRGLIWRERRNVEDSADIFKMRLRKEESPEPEQELLSSNIFLS